MPTWCSCHIARNLHMESIIYFRICFPAHLFSFMQWNITSQRKRFWFEQAHEKNVTLFSVQILRVCKCYNFVIFCTKIYRLKQFLYHVIILIKLASIDFCFICNFDMCVFGNPQFSLCAKVRCCILDYFHFHFHFSQPQVTRLYFYGNRVKQQ